MDTTCSQIFFQLKKYICKLQVWLFWASIKYLWFIWGYLSVGITKFDIFRLLRLKQHVSKCQKKAFCFLITVKKNKKCVNRQCLCNSVLTIEIYIVLFYFDCYEDDVMPSLNVICNCGAYVDLEIILGLFVHSYTPRCHYI